MKTPSLGWWLAAKGFIRKEDVGGFLSMQYRIPTIDLEAYEVAEEILALVPGDLCAAHGVLPVSRAGSSIIVAMSDPTDQCAVDAVTAATGFKVEPVIASLPAIRAAIAQYYGR